MDLVSSPHEGCRVALVEDDADVRRSMTLLFRRRGYSVDSYEDAVELLTHVASMRADCLVVDYKMPFMDGLQTIRRLREKGVSTPALMVTGYYSTTLRDRAIDAGYFDVIEKSSKPSVLFHRVVDAITSN